MAKTKEDSEARTERVQVLLTRAERAEVEREAAHQQRSVSGLLRVYVLRGLRG